MAVCAICNGRIAARGDLSIAGSEVFHKWCVRQKGTATSALNRARTEALASDTARHHAAVEANQVLERRDALIRDLNAENHELQAEIAKLKREATTREVTVLAQRSQLFTATTDVARLERELAEARRLRDAAISEAALHQTIQRSGPVSVHRDTVAAVPVEVDERDPTEVRMSLLDLDLDK